MVVWILCSGCGGAKNQRPLSDPPIAVDGWTRHSLARGETQIPPVLAELGARESLSATYRNQAAAVGIRAFRMAAGTAFEAQQKWRRGETETSLYRGDVFIVCTAETAQQRDLVNFCAALEAAWLAGEGK